MCKQVSPLRVVGFVFLILAFLAVLLGFFAPWWIRLPNQDLIAIVATTPSTAESTTLQNDESAPRTTTSTVPVQDRHDGQQQANAGAGQAALTTTTASGSDGGQTTGSDGDKLQDLTKSIVDSLLANGTYIGLWATCHQNLSCKCFTENNFELELAFSDVHKAVQGIYGIGLVVLFIGLLIACFHICCCCHCCRESYVIATVIGSFIASGLILIFLALAIFAGFYAWTKQVEIVGDKVFEFAFYVPIGGIGVALIAAILFLVDGRRGPSDSDGDGEETAKMV